MAAAATIYVTNDFSPNTTRPGFDNLICRLKDHRVGDLDEAPLALASADR